MKVLLRSASRSLVFLRWPREYNISSFKQGIGRVELGDLVVREYS